MKPLLALTLLMMAGGSAFAQMNTDPGGDTVASNKDYIVSGQVAGGYARTLTDIKEQNGITVNRDQFFSYAQMRWLPGNLLTGSLEVGYMNFYSVTSDSGGKSVRSAVPISAVFSMELVPGLEASGGFGVALLSSTVTGGAGTATSSAVSFAIMGSLAYLYPVSENLKIGAEGRISYMDLYDDKVAGIGLVVRYELFRY